MMQTLKQVASEYSKALNDAAKSAVPGEPEAQLTTPVANLLVQLSEIYKVGDLTLIRETRLDRTRPDFAVFLTKAGKTYQKVLVSTQN
ncbi:hypothetical protein ASD54_22075 [Rhizobium sp. Root149]|nr:hypothetical protein ASD54_22075 [Rhizobium sp. Root149]